MRKMTYFIGQSIDGCISAENGDFSFLLAYQDMWGWMLENCPETLPTAFHEATGTDPTPKLYDTVLMGRATYEPGLQQGMPSPYAHMRQYVVTKSLTESPSPDVTLVADDPVATVRALKAEDGDKGIWLCGGATLAGALYDEIDELVVKTYPVLAGSGIPLFRGAPFRPRPFTVVETERFDDGGSVTRYLPAT